MIPGRSGRPLRIRLLRPRSSEGARLPLIPGPASPYVPLPSDDAVGREDEGQLVSYTVQLCDNGPAGSGSDFWSIFLPSEGYGHSGSVTSGDIVKQ